MQPCSLIEEYDQDRAMQRDDKKKSNFFERFSSSVTCWTGTSAAFIIALSVVLVWGLTGPFFQYSDTWQLVVNTGTGIVTFLMVFLIQKSQNKDSKAIQLKLNELIAANKHTSNRMVDIEELEERELDELRQFYTKLSQLADKDGEVENSHSIDRAEKLQERKNELQEKERRKSRK